jgi:hypothetical protein
LAEVIDVTQIGEEVEVSIPIDEGEAFLKHSIFDFSFTLLFAIAAKSNKKV